VWAAPTIAVATAAPAFATSAPVLNSQFSFDRAITSSSDATMTIGGEGPSSVGVNGVWIENATATTTVSGLTLTLFMSNNWNNSTTVTDLSRTTPTVWTLPTRTGAAQFTGEKQAPSGYTFGYAYQFTYTGTFSFQGETNSLVANNRPWFQFARQGSYKGDSIVWVRREAMIDGVWRMTQVQRTLSDIG